MNILITGGSGFIGSNYIKLLLETRDDKIFNYDVLTYAGNEENILLKKIYENYHFIKGDIRNEHDLELVLKKHDIDAIVNFAAETHVDRSISRSKNFITTNIIGTYTLLELARKYDIKKYVQISTDEVYGSAVDNSFNENDNLNPSSPYSSSKASADLLARSYYKTYDLNINITRSTNNFGPLQHPEKLIPKIIVNALINKKIPIYGDGSQVRDGIYVGDNCIAIDLVLTKGAPGEVYNIASKNEYANLMIVKMILKKLNKSSLLIDYVEDRPGHDQKYSINDDKIRNNLGFKPANTFKPKLNQTINWYLNNRKWWLRLIK